MARPRRHARRGAVLPKAWAASWPWIVAAALSLVIGALSAQPAAAANEPDAEAGDGTYWSEANRGWFFYEPKPNRQPRTAVPANPGPSGTLAGKHPDLVRFEELQRRVEETRNIAIINPTEENLRNFLYAQHEALERASRFGEAAQRVVWATPEIDPTVQGRPTSAPGMAEYDAQQSQRAAQKFAQLSQTHGFFFFFRSDCPFCHRFAPILQQFSERTGIRVMAVSMDGGALPSFPDAVPDNGIAQRLNVEQVPALFLAEPLSGRVLPIGYGVISPVDLERRVDLVTRPGADAIVPSAVRHVEAPRHRQ